MRCFVNGRLIFAVVKADAKALGMQQEFFDRALGR